MRLLVLGGTLFLGRHVATAALDRGHDVATFTRGVSGDPPDGARALHGDRGSPRRVHRRRARAPVSTSVSGGTTSRSARRAPPAQVRQTTPASMLRKPPVRTVRPWTTTLRGTGDQASRA